MKKFYGLTRSKINQWSRLIVFILFIAISLTPLFGVEKASSAQLTSRKVTVSTSKAASAGVTYSFSFTTATAATIQSMVFQFCNTPLGTCTLPGTDGTPSASETIDVSATSTVEPGAFTGTTNTPAFAEYTTVTNGCTLAGGGSGVAKQFCVTRSQAISEAAGVKTFAITGIRNPIITNTTYETVYVRITTYSDATFLTPVDTGTVAAGITQQLTVNGVVQERLIFCVAAIADADNVPSPSSCPATTTIDLGVIDNSSVKIAPQNAVGGDNANDAYGVAVINTNASGGAVIAYFAEANGTQQTRSFRVSGATCNADPNTLTDQCFKPAAYGTALTSGVEGFGMVVPCLNKTATGTTNLTVATGYNGDDDTVTHTVGTDCENEGETTFQWNDTATADTIASSSAAIDDEGVKLGFGARAATTTATGAYTVTTTYIATPTF